MTIEKMLNKKERNYTEEKEILKEFSSILKSIYSKKEIENVLEENGFNGVYLVDSKTYSKVVRDKSDGMYEHDKKIIILDLNAYMKNKFIGLHEMGHAFLDGKIRKDFILEKTRLSFGRGIEEGAMSLLMNTSDIRDISKATKHSYFHQARLFQQLNVLYGNSKSNEYQNLLIHMLKDPDNFLPLIRDIYYDLYEKAYQETDMSIITDSAYGMIEGMDLLTNCKNFNANIYMGLQFLNAIYLSITDDQIRYGKEVKPFCIPSKCLITREQALLSAIFGESDYMETQHQNIISVLSFLQEQFEVSIPKKDNKRVSLK